MIDAVTRKAKELVNMVADLEIEVDGQRQRAAQHHRIIDKIPRCFPDGAGMLSPSEWIAWAKKEPGYVVPDNRSAVQKHVESLRKELGEACRECGSPCPDDGTGYCEDCFGG